MIYAEISLIALCAGILQGLTGFGAGIVMMMILPSFFPLNQAAGVSCAIAIVLSLSMVFRYRTCVRLKKVIGPALLYISASSISIYFSTMVNQILMKRIFGIFLVLLAVYYLVFNRNQEQKLSLMVSIVFITVSGICDGLFGIGGPLMVLYYLGQTDSREEYLGTIQALFLASLVYGTGLRLYNHILTPSHLPCMGLGMICILLGLVLASRITDLLDGEKIRKLTYVVIGISGILNTVP